MNRKQTIKTGILLLAVMMLFAACSTQTETMAVNDIPAQAEENDDHMDDDEDGDHQEGDAQHMDDGGDHMPHVETPDEFAGLTNPYTDDHEAIEAGEATYTTLCASCHGIDGDGDGVAAAGLTPSPAKLSDGGMMGMIGDDYLFWRISKGGAMEPFNSSMVAWESALTEEQRWQVISYIRTLSGEGGMMEGGMMEGGMMDDSHDDG